jgi:hypothetical protein
VLVAALAFILPGMVRGFANWDMRVQSDQRALTPGLVEALREAVPPGSVVFAGLETSYRIAAAVPLYVASAPPSHVADTGDNRPRKRAEDTRDFLRTGDLAIPRRYGAGWLVLAADELAVPLRPRYDDGSFRLYRLGGAR